MMLQVRCSANKVILPLFRVNHDMNVIIKRERTGSVNQIKKRFAQAKRKRRKLDFDTTQIPRELFQGLLVICGDVPSQDVTAFRKKASALHSDFVHITPELRRDVQTAIREQFDSDKHKAVLLIGNLEQLPPYYLYYKGEPGFTDYFYQDITGDHKPDVPVGRIFGTRNVVLHHMDPPIIDSDIAIIFDTEPNRSSRHVVALHKLGFDVEILRKYHPDDAELLASSEFILQFSDGHYTRRIHGNPEAWLSHSTVVLAHNSVETIDFKGYPVVFSEACSTANNGPLLRAFLQKGACYIGSPFETVNNVRPFNNWRECASADGWKFGFLDLLDTFDTIGEVKINVDINLYINLDDKFRRELKDLSEGETSQINSDETLSVVEWNLFGNPLRISTRGPKADFVPGRIVVDT